MRFPALVIASVMAAATPAEAQTSLEDACVLAAARVIPAGTSIETTKTAPAPIPLVTQLHRDTALRWARVDFGMSIGGRKMTQSYICGANRNGDHVVVSMDGKDWIVR